MKFESAQVDNMVGEYVASRDAGDDYEARRAVVDKLAAEYKVSDKVIQGKLVSEGVYKAKALGTAKTKGTVTNKEDLVKAVEAAMCMEIKSMRNMTKIDLEKFWARLVEMSTLQELK